MTFTKEDLIIGAVYDYDPNAPTMHKGHLHRTKKVRVLALRDRPDFPVLGEVVEATEDHPVFSVGYRGHFAPQELTGTAKIEPGTYVPGDTPTPASFMGYVHVLFDDGSHDWFDDLEYFEPVVVLEHRPDFTLRSEGSRDYPEYVPANKVAALFAQAKKEYYAHD